MLLEKATRGYFVRQVPEIVSHLPVDTNGCTCVVESCIISSEKVKKVL